MNKITVKDKLKIKKSDVEKYSGMVIVSYDISPLTSRFEDGLLANNIFIRGLSWDNLNRLCWSYNVLYREQDVCHPKYLFVPSKSTGSFWMRELAEIVDSGSSRKVLEKRVYRADGAMASTINLMLGALDEKNGGVYAREIWMQERESGKWVKKLSVMTNKEQMWDYTMKNWSLKSAPMKSTRKQQKDGKKMYGQYKGMVGDVKQMGKQFSKNFKKLI